MNRQAILEQFDRLNIWSRGDQRAPHKPLLVLYALGRSRGESGDLPFRDTEPILTALFKEFGPSRQSYHPEYPFWRLQNNAARRIPVCVFAFRSRRPADGDRMRLPSCGE